MAEAGMVLDAAKTVLVVEDNDLNMKLFHDLLEAHGYNIIQTKDGMIHVIYTSDERQVIRHAVFDEDAILKPTKAP